MRRRQHSSSTKNSQVSKQKSAFPPNGPFFPTTRDHARAAKARAHLASSQASAEPTFSRSHKVRARRQAKKHARSRVAALRRVRQERESNGALLRPRARPPSQRSPAPRARLGRRRRRPSSLWRSARACAERNRARARGRAQRQRASERARRCRVSACACYSPPQKKNDLLPRAARLVPSLILPLRPRPSANMPPAFELPWFAGPESAYSRAGAWRERARCVFFSPCSPPSCR